MWDVAVQAHLGPYVNVVQDCLLVFDWPHLRDVAGIRPVCSFVSRLDHYCSCTARFEKMEVFMHRCANTGVRLCPRAELRKGSYLVETW